MEADQVELRIYSGFTEVIRSIEAETSYRLTFSGKEMDQIVPNSIFVDSDHVNLQTITPKSSNLEGNLVFVRFDKDKPARKAILVRGEDWLVQDEETQRYYNASRPQLEFEKPPDKKIYHVDISFSEPTKAALSYLIKTISWVPRYHIQVKTDAERPSIKCIAIVKNKSPTKYFVRKAELYGGQVSISHPQPRTTLLRSSRIASESNDGVPASSDFSGTDMSGVFRYQLENSFAIDAESTMYVEFLRPNITLTQSSVLEVTNPGDFRISMNRLCTLTSDQFLPSGEICLRQDGRIVGNHQLLDLPAGENREFTIGRDGSSILERKETVLEKNESSVKLLVKLIIISSHKTQREFRYLEKNTIARFTMTYDLSSAGNSIRHIQEGIELKCKIEPGESFQSEYTITKSQRDNRGIMRTQPGHV